MYTRNVRTKNEYVAICEGFLESCIEQMNLGQKRGPQYACEAFREEAEGRGASRARTSAEPGCDDSKGD